MINPTHPSKRNKKNWKKWHQANPSPKTLGEGKKKRRT
jgi:hypothetical protein